MFVCFYRRRMIAIFPVGAFSILPLIEFLPGPTRPSVPNYFGSNNLWLRFVYSAKRVRYKTNRMLIAIIK